MSSLLVGRAGNAIVGGSAVVRARSWMASIVATAPTTKAIKDRLLCGGTLVAPQWILTAAHCVAQANAHAGKVPTASDVLALEQHFTVVVGRDRLSDTAEGVVRTIAQVDVYPQYKPNARVHCGAGPCVVYGSGDVALLMLSTPVPGNLQPLPIAGAADVSRWASGHTLSIFGNGNMLASPSTTDALRSALVKMGNPAWAADAFTFSYESGEICSGDSGGPVTVGSYPNERQIGVISSFFGPSCTARTSVMLGATVGYAAARPLNTWIRSVVPGGGAPCAFVLAPGSAPAFCETFDQPTPTAGSRSGDLNGVLWGVSRATSANNETQGRYYDWASTVLNRCGTNVAVAPDRDVQICNGQMIEAVNDSGGQTLLAAYPRQPFDFAGRTGTVAFDVSDNTQGAHASWPAFALTDQPVPAPYDVLPAVADNARDSIGVEFGNACSSPSVCGLINHPTCVGVNNIYDTVGYVPHDLAFTKDGCVQPSPAVGVDNHVEIQFAATGIKVYMSNPGTASALKLVAHANFAVPLTRGLVWLEDAHYNANKFDTQQTNTFSWDNLAFDGPVLPRDLGFDVLDNTHRAGTAENGLPMTDIGYAIPAGAGRTLTVTIKNVRNTAGAAAALLELTFWPQARETLTYSVNGNPPHALPWAYGASSPTFESKTIALPVPLSEVHDGTNTVTLSTSDTANGVTTANYDLILAGAGG